MYETDTYQSAHAHVHDWVREPFMWVMYLWGKYLTTSCESRICEQASYICEARMLRLLRRAQRTSSLSLSLSLGGLNEPDCSGALVSLSLSSLSLRLLSLSPVALSKQSGFLNDRILSCFPGDKATANVSTLLHTSAYGNTREHTVWRQQECCQLPRKATAKTTASSHAIPPN